MNGKRLIDTAELLALTDEAFLANCRDAKAPWLRHLAGGLLGRLHPAGDHLLARLEATDTAPRPGWARVHAYLRLVGDDVLYPTMIDVPRAAFARLRQPGGEHAPVA